MTTMDAKAISWVGDIYDKFEAMCVEVEETMYQESIKYVENQVKTVGASVKRFYSDVMQDLLPLSEDDLSKLENTGLKLVQYADNGIYNKSDVDVKGEQLKSEIGHVSMDSYLASQVVGNISSSGSYNSGNLYELPSQEATAVKCQCLQVKQSGTEELCLCNNKKSDMKFRPTEISRSEDVGSQLALLSREGESMVGLGKVSDETAQCLGTSIAKSLSNATARKGFENEEDTSKMSNGSNDESVEHGFESDNTDKESFQVSEQLGKLKLDESCVLIDKHEDSSFSDLEGKQGSYKKKIRDVFYLRRWSSMKNGEQQNAWKEDAIAASTLESDYINLQSSSLESDWEIL